MSWIDRIDLDKVDIEMDDLGLGFYTITPKKGLRMKRKFGWKRQLPDYRDYHFSSLDRIELVSKESLPDMVDLRSQCPDVYDQGELGSCTANAIAFACEFDLHKQNEESYTPSRLFIYYNEREMEGTVSSDSGAVIRDGMKSIDEFGFLPEVHWPYDETKFSIKPSPAVYAEAFKKNIALKDYGVVNQTDVEMKQAIASGYPIVLGFIVFESFMSQRVARTGIVGAPRIHERPVGGHAVAIVGYDKHGWIVRNSWGKNWGMDGYFHVPFGYFENPHLASDLWIIRMVP
jgi:C1A family cysteine protease